MKKVWDYLWRWAVASVAFWGVIYLANWEWWL